MTRRIALRLFLAVLCAAGVGANSYFPAAAEEPVETGAPVAADGPVVLDTGRIIVRFKNSANSPDKNRLHATIGAALLERLGRFNLDVVSVSNPRLTRALAALYARSPLVEFAEPDALVSLADDATLIPNDPLYAGYQWQHPAIDSPEAWSVTTGGPYRITICDTGVSATHEDLAPNLLTSLGRNVVSNPYTNDFSPVHWHGTSVAGSAAAAGNNSIGVAGVAWTAEIIPVRISNFSNGSAFISDMVDCIEWGADNGSTVINVSYQSYSNGQVFSSLITAANYADQQGSVVVFAAGNENTNPVGTQDPANIVYVAATASNDTKASFSNFGPFVDLAAPGVSVVSTYITCHTSSCSVFTDDQYAYVSGTSFAAPITAGAILAVKAANPSFTTDQLRAAITSSACDLGAAGEDDVFGAGLLNVHHAVHGESCSPLESIQVTPAGPAAEVGGQVQFTATGTYENSNQLDITDLVSWASSDEAVATIDASGLAQALSEGPAAITASLDGITSNQAALTVTPAPCNTGEFTAEYFSNQTFTGPPTFTQCETAIDYNWGEGGPGNSVPNDNFSVRWTGTFEFDADDYTFFARGDTRIVVRLDGQVILDPWNFEAEQEVTLPVGAGSHQILVEHYEGAGAARAHFGWAAFSASGCASGEYFAEYFSNQTFSGPATFTQCETAIDYNWGEGGPGNGVPDDNFSARWTGAFEFDGGDYTFSARGDTKIVVWLDGQVILDLWNFEGEQDVTLPVSAGSHQIKVEHYEGAGVARAHFSWEAFSASACQPGEYFAEYFANTSFSGPPTFTQCETTIDYNWGAGGPGNGVPDDDFSARWTGTFDFTAGDYSFFARGDTRIVVRLDGQVILDLWNFEGEQSISVAVSEGSHQILVEQFEVAGAARAHFWWVPD